MGAGALSPSRTSPARTPVPHGRLRPARLLAFSIVRAPCEARSPHTVPSFLSPRLRRNTPVPSAKLRTLTLPSPLPATQNFENWAPRSSRAWRLRERPTEVSVVPQVRPPSAAALLFLLSPPSPPAFPPRRRPMTRHHSPHPPKSPFPPQDGVLAEAEAAGPASPVNPDAALSGVELARLCFAKYGKYHDMAIKHTRIQKARRSGRGRAGGEAEMPPARAARPASLLLAPAPDSARAALCRRTPRGGSP